MSDANRLYADLERVASVPRMQTYSSVCATEAEAAALYLWNQSLSESLYTSISTLEIAMRSAMHKVLTTKLGSSWFPRVFKGKALDEYNEVMSDLTTQGVPPPDSQIVANLTLGKWVNLLQNGRCGWLNAAPYPLYDVFPNYPVHSRLERNKIHELLSYALQLRNRVMHHEPVLGGVRIPNKPIKSIDAIHSDIIESIGWIDTEMQRVVNHFDRFDTVFQRGMHGFLADVQLLS